MTASTFHLRILTPDRTLVDTQVSAVVVPGSEGEFTVLPGHMAVISALKDGEISVYQPAMHTESFRITGGFVDVGQDHCTILAENVIETKAA